MSTSPNYERPYSHVEYQCECGIKYGIDFEFSRACAPQEFQHCEKGEVIVLGGPMLALWEEIDGKWILVRSSD